MASFTDLLAAHHWCCKRFLSATRRNGFGLFRSTRRIADLIERGSRWVHAVGIGFKVSNGKPTRTLAVRLYVPHKLPKSLIALGDLLPTEQEIGIPVDVIASMPAFLHRPAPSRRSKSRSRSRSKTRSARKTKNIRAQDDRAFVRADISDLPERQRRQRPITPGISAGHFGVTAGTIACFCRTKGAGDGQVYVLSNNHIFSNIDASLQGDDLLQPGRVHGGTSEDHFADFERDVELLLGGSGQNEVDASIGRLAEGMEFTPEIPGIGRISGLKEAKRNLEVCMHGSTSGLVAGIVDDIEYAPVVGFDPDDPTAVASFVRQIRVQAVNVIGGGSFGRSGDSGSLVVEKGTNRAVGLYFAGPENGAYGVANRIAIVLDKLRIEIIEAV